MNRQRKDKQDPMPAKYSFGSESPNEIAATIAGIAHVPSISPALGEALHAFLPPQQSIWALGVWLET
jgi:hypothetical protein